MQQENHPFKSKFKESNELIRTLEAFRNAPATMRMVEVKTGILRPNICRYVARLLKEGKIRLVRFNYCPHTHHIAGFYSSDIEHLNTIYSDHQLFLF
jgi:hypothetical protein